MNSFEKGKFLSLAGNRNQTAYLQTSPMADRTITYPDCSFSDHVPRPGRCHHGVRSHRILHCRTYPRGTLARPGHPRTPTSTPTTPPLLLPHPQQTLTPIGKFLQGLLLGFRSFLTVLPLTPLRSNQQRLPTLLHMLMAEDIIMAKKPPHDT